MIYHTLYIYIVNRVFWQVYSQKEVVEDILGNRWLLFWTDAAPISSRWLFFFLTQIPDEAYVFYKKDNKFSFLLEFIWL